MKKFTKGFTLIELLIVIALLGALAVGLLAALDPFEQLKKGTDTGVRNTASELHGAIVRYYAIKNIMPWCTTAAACAVDGFTTGGSNTGLKLKPTVIENIVATGELKTDFSALATDGVLEKLIVFGDNSTAKVEVCFQPLAKSFIVDPNTKFSPTTGLTGCLVPNNTNPNSCLWCIN